MNLSPHFSLLEATKSQKALRWAIDNTPTPVELANLIQTAKGILEPVRLHYGIPFSPSSWYRCPELNKTLGSNKNSQHVTGEAVDFEVPGVSNLALAYWIWNNLPFDQLILEFYTHGIPNSGWVHCSLTRTNRRSQVLTYDGKFYMAGLPVEP